MSFFCASEMSSSPSISSNRHNTSLVMPTLETEENNSILLVGDSNSGKSALFTRYSTGTYSTSQIMPKNQNFIVKDINIVEKTIKMTIWVRFIEISLHTNIITLSFISTIDLTSIRMHLIIVCTNLISFQSINWSQQCFISFLTNNSPSQSVSLFALVFDFDFFTLKHIPVYCFITSLCF